MQEDYYLQIYQSQIEKDGKKKIFAVCNFGRYNDGAYSR